MSLICRGICELDPDMPYLMNGLDGMLGFAPLFPGIGHIGTIGDPIPRIRSDSR